MDSFRDVYNRFKKNYRTDTGGINLYPQFDSDLELLLEWLENDDAMADIAINGDWIPEPEWVDCSWRQVEQEG